MQSIKNYKPLFYFFLIGILPGVAFAHHPNGYKLPNSLFEGLLSGLGHPVIGLDHLVFIIGIGLLSYLMRQRFTVPFVFIIGTLVGAITHLNSVSIPFSESLIAISIVLLGFVLIYKSEKTLSTVWYFSLTGAGILHGYAYGESIVGAEVTSLGAYLIGFSAIQLSISLIVGVLCLWLNKSQSIPANNLSRLYGGVAVCTGTFFLV
ncbi:MAG: HupE/UreJ family protein [Porticoccaceae bacterium]